MTLDHTPRKVEGPDFSNDEELKGQPDAQRFLVRILKAKNAGDFETALVESQKLLFLNRKGNNFHPDVLAATASYCERLERYDDAIGYTQEALEQVRGLEYYQKEEKELTERLQRFYKFYD